MLTISLPEFDYNIKKIDDVPHIFDITRKKFIKITPEEWVRQHFVHLLINNYQYPKTLISSEKGLLVNKLNKRTDILVYTNEMKPFLLIECKAPNIKLNQAVFDQAANYNKTINAPYICICNGNDTFCCAVDTDTKQYSFLKDLPQYPL